MTDLDQVFPQGSDISIAGENLTVKPLKVGQLPGFLRAIGPVMTHLSGEAIDWLAVLGERGGDLLAAIAIAVGKPRDWVDDLAPDEAVLLAATVIEVNADFFSRQVVPRLSGLFDRIARAVPAGSTPSTP